MYSLPKADTTTAFAKELIVPFWLVRPTGDKDRANMHRSTIVCKMSVAAGKEECTCDPVLVPILTNTKTIQQGDELLIYSENLVAPTYSIERSPEMPAAAASAPKRSASEPKHQPKKKAMKRR